MWLTLFQILQAASGLLLIVLILIHSPKGDGLGGIGGAAQMFSTQRETEAGLNKITYIVVAVFFALTAITGFYGNFLASL
ncbi:MAG: preprotein translocase subunit SecG [Cyanobacteria bacterium HKST-UBA06]|nr:preprotein translocase subunit SecG [Cyanobacteria bacterium HKST-UBA05]MCA9799983.1 preprotein translocase subunit SecG [Cyanobacteria bacterium HKST-UBA04]MCA9808312.1 preprotein translocase subunit SecG [Cyanobacteria bacterium HKST-UBA06]MCA9841942.1 preprotein translocase subunit SecG [Cyanobacteria bacterium HKST-UBA03]